MASVLGDPSGVKQNRCSNPSRKVRIVGKIRGLTETESETLSQNSKPWITVKNPEEIGSSEKCKVLFETQSTGKNGYELDYCYGQHEEIDHIFAREIQPMILEVFDGRNASVIAMGARGSGKTCTIQGSKEKPGLAVIAMSEILSKAKELGKSVSVSLYELTQEHVKDLLKHDHPTIHVLEDAQGKINIKGLSQVPVKSITEFYDMYFTQSSSQNTQKVTIDQPHKGLMVHIWSNDDKMKAKLPTKINFVDLAGYEDLRKSSRDGIAPTESNRKNKSLYALLNVLSAINANEMRVPYRESKLTRILQDSLGGKSHVLLLTCLNPSFCQDSLSTISLISRLYRSTKQVLTDSTNRSQNSVKVKELSSLENRKTMSASLSVKKQIGHSRLLSTKQASCILQGRKLFDEVKRTNSKQLRRQSEGTSLQKSKTRPTLALVVAPLSLEEAPQDKSVAESRSLVEVEQIEDVNCREPESLPMLKLENSLLPSAINDEPTHVMKMDVSHHSGIHNLEDRSSENNPLHKKDTGSPLLSERIREVKNNLKALCESTPSMIELPRDVVAPYYNDIVEPKTPALELSNAVCCTPQGSFSNRGSRVKDSLVKEYLHFLNSANKEDLKSVKGIGEKRAKYILEMREESPEPFKTLDDLRDIGLSAKQVKGLMKQVAGNLFD